MRSTYYRVHRSDDAPQAPHRALWSPSGPPFACPRSPRLKELTMIDQLREASLAGFAAFSHLAKQTYG